MQARRNGACTALRVETGARAQHRRLARVLSLHYLAKAATAAGDAPHVCHLAKGCAKMVLDRDAALAKIVPMLSKIDAEAVAVGDTKALMLVCASGRADIARLLLDEGADMRATKASGWSPLMEAVRAQWLLPTSTTSRCRRTAPRRSMTPRSRTSPLCTTSIAAAAVATAVATTFIPSGITWPWRRDRLSPYL